MFAHLYHQYCPCRCDEMLKFKLHARYFGCNRDTFLYFPFSYSLDKTLIFVHLWPLIFGFALDKVQSNLKEEKYVL